MIPVLSKLPDRLILQNLTVLLFFSVAVSKQSNGCVLGGHSSVCPMTANLLAPIKVLGISVESESKTELLTVVGTWSFSKITSS